MAFHVISLAPGLNDQEMARAVEAGPPNVAAPEGYSEMLASAGFEVIEEVDLTDQWRETAAAWLRESAHAQQQLEEIFGVEEHRQSQQERQEKLAAIEGGLLKRSLFVTRRV